MHSFAICDVWIVRVSVRSCVLAVCVFSNQQLLLSSCLLKPLPDVRILASQ